ncbi:hypothetical protein KCP78_21960 [Salmonella enterica subsp. enterica]|nr:hypothetical protein KCP78_21960 [Salmonella enterica subsp. enterica]
MPIIYDVAIKNNIRPERFQWRPVHRRNGYHRQPVRFPSPLFPVAMLGNVTFDGKHLEFLDLLSITIPLHPARYPGNRYLVGSAVKIWIKTKRFRNLFPYRKTVSTYGDTATLLDKNRRKATGWRCGSSRRRLPWSLSPARTPTYVQIFGGKPLSMVLVAQMFMLPPGRFIIILTKPTCVYLKKRSFSFRYDCDCRYTDRSMAETMFGAHMSEIPWACWAKWSKSICGPTPSFCCWSPSVNSCSGAGGDCSRRAGYRCRSGVYRGPRRHVMATMYPRRPTRDSGGDDQFDRSGTTLVLPLLS